MICFVHIERAGGTTLHWVLRNNFLSFVTTTPSRWTNDDATALSADDLAALLRWLPPTAGFGGHDTRSYLGYEKVVGRPVRYFTFLRDPLKRYVSHLNYQVHEMGLDWTPETFLEEKRFDNFMTKRIAGEYDVELAQKRLAEDFAFVGLSNRFDESLLLMRQALGVESLDVRYEVRNASRDPQHREHSRELFEDAGFMAQARKRNALDLELYDFVEAELYPRFVARYGDGLARDVGEMKIEREGFRFGVLRRACWSAYRGAIYSRLERRIRSVPRELSRG